MWSSELHIEMLLIAVSSMIGYTSHLFETIHDGMDLIGWSNTFLSTDSCKIFKSVCCVILEFRQDCCERDCTASISCKFVSHCNKELVIYSSFTLSRPNNLHHHNSRELLWWWAALINDINIAWSRWGGIPILIHLYLYPSLPTLDVTPSTSGTYNFGINSSRSLNLIYKLLTTHLLFISVY